MLYSFARAILLPFFKIFFRLKVFGKENFPVEGPLIVASNHASFLDPVIVGIITPRKMNFLARDTLFRSKIFAKILYLLNVLPLRREKRDINAFRLSLRLLSQGKPLLIFPEGTRSEDGNLQKPRYGIGLLEALSGAAIVPCYVKGSMDALPRHSAFPKFKPISVHFGAPLKFGGQHIPKDKKERYRQVAVEVMAAIQELKKNAD